MRRCGVSEVLVSLLCQNKYKMRWDRANRLYTCDGTGHGSWKCKPTYRRVQNGDKVEILTITDTRSNPLPSGKPPRR